MTDGRRIVQLTVAAAGVAALAAASQAASKRDKVPLPRPRPAIHEVFSPVPLATLPRPRPATHQRAQSFAHARLVALPRPRPAIHEALQPFSRASSATLPSTLSAVSGTSAALAYARPDTPLPASPTDSTPAADIAIVKRAADLVRRDQFSKATELKSSISDPVARKLVEWMILRGDPNHSPGFERYAAFVAENPSWPSVGLLRSRAEAALWDDRHGGKTVLAYFATTEPRTAKGHFALANALISRGDKRTAERHVRAAWQTEWFAPAVERIALDVFARMLRPVDHRARMHRRLYAGDSAGGLRSARRLGAADVAIAKAWAAVNRQAKNAKALLDAVPKSARRDAGYVFSLARWLRRHDKDAKAAQVLLKRPHDTAVILDPDEWWIETRLVARALIEAGEHQTAYRVAQRAPMPDKDAYRVDHQFTAGWIALRFLNDPATASRHFATIADRTRNPTALARAGYWRGRAAEAEGRSGDARSHYTAAARFRTTYYGQLALARLGETAITLPERPVPSPKRRAVIEQLEIVRALSIIYAADVRDLAIPMVARLAERTGDTDVLATAAEITRKHGDARATLLIGKGALNQALGAAFAHYAFPTIGVPRYKPIGPDVHASLLYSIIRTESAFQPIAISSARATGLMQVMPATGRYIARKFKVPYSRKRLLNDPAYNVQLGAAELADLISDYNGSYILAFVGYNAGRGRVRDWVERFGDPRDHKVDPVDWVEMIPFSETRNYVQRILENVQVYRARFGAAKRPTIEADLRRGAVKN